MMHPDAVGDWRPGSSDDEWSIIDEPEVHLNKVSDEDAKESGLAVVHPNNFSDVDVETPFRRAQVFQGDATKLEQDKGKLETSCSKFPSSELLLPDSANKEAQILQERPKLPVLDIVRVKTDQHSKPEEVTSKPIQAQLPVSFAFEGPAQVMSTGNSGPGKPLSAFARVCTETGSMLSMSTAELKGGERSSTRSSEPEEARSAITSEGCKLDGNRYLLPSDLLFDVEQPIITNSDAQYTESEEESCKVEREDDEDKDDAQTFSGTESNEQSGSDEASECESEEDEESECESEEDPVNRRHRADLPVSAEPGSGEAVAQLEKDIRAASKPLTVEPPCTTRYHRILVAGQMGCGKSTFIKCVSAALKDLTLEDFTPDPEVRYMALRARGDLQGAGCKHHFMIEELKSQPMHDSTWLRQRIEAGVSYYQSEYLRHEQCCNRTEPMSEYSDNRIDVCLWFLQAVTAKEVKDMMQLTTHVPVIPVLAKADAMTHLELTAMRRRLAELMKVEEEELASQGPPSVASPLPAIYKQAGIQGIFAVAASTDKDYSVNRHGWPIRTYPWGVVEPMLSAHSDLLTLTHVLFELTPEQLKVATEERFSRYRRQQTGSKITMASLRSILFFLFLAGCFVGFSFLNFLVWNRLSSSYPSGSEFSSNVQQSTAAGSPLLYQANATSAAISAKVDEILQHEPLRQDWQVVAPLTAVLDSQSSFEEWLKSSVTGTENAVALVNLFDSLFSSLRVQTSAMQDTHQGEQPGLGSEIKSSHQSENSHNADNSICASPARRSDSIQQDFAGHFAKFKSKLRSKIADIDGRARPKRVRKAAKKMKKVQSKLHGHTAKLGKKMQSLLRKVNSKRLLRRVLVANAWL